MAKANKKTITLNDLSKEMKTLTGTVDNLAISTNKNFERVEKNFERVENILKTTANEIMRMNSDIRDIKGSVGPLARIAGEQDRKIISLENRIERLEKKF